MHSIRNHSDYVAFLDVMRCLGIPVDMMHQLSKDPWQAIVIEAGYSITSLACTGMRIGTMVYVFSCGEPYWVSKNVDGKCDDIAFGPDSSFMFAYDQTTNKIIDRRLVKFADGSVVGDLKAIDAIAAQHHLGKIPKGDSFPGKLTIDGNVFDVSYLNGVVSGYSESIEGKSYSLEVPAFEMTFDEYSELEFKGTT